MKNLFRSRRLGASVTGLFLVVTSLAVSGCSQPALGSHTAIIAGARAGMPAVFDQSSTDSAALMLPSFGDALRSQASNDSSVTVLTADGDPRATSSLDLKVDRTNPRSTEGSTSRNTTALASAVLAAQATAPESNIILALDTAGRAVAGQSSPSVLVVDSGISTTGPLMFQNGLIGPKTDVATIVNQLREAGNLPSLQGTRVRWWGLGQVSAPQSTVPVWARDKLKALYTAIIKDSGGTVEFFDEPIPMTTAPQGLPQVSPVTFSDTTAAPVALVIPDSMLRFEADSADFVDAPAAGATLENIAAQLAKTQHAALYITGCTSLPPGADPGRMEEVATSRAEAVARELTARGVGNIRPRGYGPNCPGRILDTNADGTAIPTAQEQNRKVLVTSSDIQAVPAT